MARIPEIVSTISLFRNEIDEKLVVRDPEKSLREGAMTITGWNLDNGKMTQLYFGALANHYGFSLDIDGEFVLDIDLDIFSKDILFLFIYVG